MLKLTCNIELKDFTLQNFYYAGCEGRNNRFVEDCTAPASRMQLAALAAMLAAILHSFL